MKTYEIVYKPTLRWDYVVKDPYNLMNIRNMDETCYRPTYSEKEYAKRVNAENAEQAKALLAVEIYKESAGRVENTPLIIDALRNIVSIKAVADVD